MGRLVSNWLHNPGHAHWLAAECDRLLDFGRAARHPSGGFAWLDVAGVPDLDRPVELWVTARMTHVYALAHLLGRPGSSALVDHGVAALTGRFHDHDHGGWYAAVAADGPTGRDKTAYEHAFVVIAAASATAADRPGAAVLLEEALEVLDGRFWDEDAGMLVEEWNEDFTVLDDYRGVNANMHGVEALLTAADVTGDTLLRDRAGRILTRVVHDLAPAHGWRIPEHFDSTWKPLLDYNRDQPADPFRPYGATVGHWLEWARLALHVHAGLGPSAPDWLLQHGQALFGQAITDGWAADGRPGFCYTVDFDGVPVVRERMHWVAAEATATAAALHAATGEDEYAEWYQTFWDHIADVFIDDRLGSWHHELSPENRPSGLIWGGKPDLYHAVQATLVPRLPSHPMLAEALRRAGG